MTDLRLCVLSSEMNDLNHDEYNYEVRRGYNNFNVGYNANVSRAHNYIVANFYFFPLFLGRISKQFKWIKLYIQRYHFC